MLLRHALYRSFGVLRSPKTNNGSSKSFVKKFFLEIRHSPKSKEKDLAITKLVGQFTIMDTNKLFESLSSNSHVFNFRERNLLIYFALKILLRQHKQLDSQFVSNFINLLSRLNFESTSWKFQPFYIHLSSKIYEMVSYLSLSTIAVELPDELLCHDLQSLVRQLQIPLASSLASSSIDSSVGIKSMTNTVAFDRFLSLLVDFHYSQNCASLEIDNRIQSVILSNLRVASNTDLCDILFRLLQLKYSWKILSPALQEEIMRLLVAEPPVVDFNHLTKYHYGLLQLCPPWERQKLLPHFVSSLTTCLNQHTIDFSQDTAVLIRSFTRVLVSMNRIGLNHSSAEAKAIIKRLQELMDQMFTQDFIDTVCYESSLEKKNIVEREFLWFLFWASRLPVRIFGESTWNSIKSILGILLERKKSTEEVLLILSCLGTKVSLGSLSLELGQSVRRAIHMFSAVGSSQDTSPPHPHSPEFPELNLAANNVPDSYAKMVSNELFDDPNIPGTKEMFRCIKELIPKDFTPPDDYFFSICLCTALMHDMHWSWYALDIPSSQYFSSLFFYSMPDSLFFKELEWFANMRASFQHFPEPARDNVLRSCASHWKSLTKLELPTTIDQVRHLQILTRDSFPINEEQQKCIMDGIRNIMTLYSINMRGVRSNVLISIFELLKNCQIDFTKDDLTLRTIVVNLSHAIRQPSIYRDATEFASLVKLLGSLKVFSHLSSETMFILKSNLSVYQIQAMISNPKGSSQK